MDKTKMTLEEQLSALEDQIEERKLELSEKHKKEEKDNETRN